MAQVTRLPCFVALPGAKKPYMLGKRGDIEPNLWQIRRDEESGRIQYYNRKLPWESGFDPPQGYVRCYKCNVDFACRQNLVGINVSTRQKVKGGKYCCKCYNKEFGRRPYVNFRNWKRYANLLATYPSNLLLVFLPAIVSLPRPVLLPLGIPWYNSNVCFARMRGR